MNFRQKAAWARVVTTTGALLLSMVLLRSQPETESNANFSPDSFSVSSTGGNPGAAILLGARRTTKSSTVYKNKYRVIPYPGGDVPITEGVCTDVVIRSLRQAGIDLQQLIHEDMLQNQSVYPDHWGQKSPDPNIDHRRVPNQICFFERHGLALSLSTSPQHLHEWQPGDIVYWRTGGRGMGHCGIISDRRNRRGVPYVIHNASRPREEDVLQAWPIIGHYRYPPQ